MNEKEIEKAEEEVDMDAVSKSDETLDEAEVEEDLDVEPEDEKG